MTSDLKYWYLHDHKLFKNLSYSEIDTLCILKKFKRSKRADTIELPYSEKPRIYFLKYGSVKLVEINELGDEVIIDLLHKGDMFGELGLDDKKSMDTQFMKVVSDEAIICTFYKESLEELIVKKPDFALNYIKFIGFNFKKVKNHYSNLFFKDAKTRLLLFLSNILEKEEIKSNTFVLPNYLTQKDIAQLICTTRQTIITLFNDLDKEGLISYSQKEILITDVEKLKKLSEKVK